MPNNESTLLQSGLTNSYPRQWVALYANYLYTYALNRVNDEELAKDLVQETFLAGLENLGNFAGRSSEKTWLTAILKNKIYAVYRKKSAGLLKNVHRTGAGTDGFFEDLDGHWLVPQRPVTFGIEHPSFLENKELKNTLERCIKKLPALWLSIFAMKHLEDLPAETICKAMHVTPANFWVIIHRAKVNLRACLQKTGIK